MLWVSTAMSKFHVYCVEAGKFLAEFPTALRAFNALSEGAIPGIVVGNSYIVCEHVKTYTPKLSFIDITDETLNRAPGSSTAPVIPKPKAEKPDQPVKTPEDINKDFEAPVVTPSGSNETDVKLSSPNLEEEEFDPDLIPPSSDLDQCVDLGE